MEKERKERLTNELFKNKFNSQFDLVNYAIKLADNLIKTGRASEITNENQNPALIILSEIAANKDRLEEIDDDDENEEAVEIGKLEEHYKLMNHTPKSLERKKNRLAL